MTRTNLALVLGPPVLLLTGVGVVVLTQAYLAGIAILLTGLIGSHRLHAYADAREQDRKRDSDMARGSVTKLVKTFGSQWGRIRPRGESRDIFFNTESLAKGVDFASVDVGQAVEFDEQADHINGSHAEHVVLAKASPGEKSTDA
jgi:cold shock CspA family protein